MKLFTSMSPSITTMIKMDHTHVLSVFHKYKTHDDPETKRGLVNTACIALEIHAQLEEEIFYPAMRGGPVDTALIEKSVPEHDEMKRLIADLRGMEPTDPAYDQTFMELMRDVMHHVADEETTLLPDAERLIPERLSELGAQMTERRMELLKPRAKDLVVNGARGIPNTSMLIAAGALVAGGYAMRRLMRRNP
jgi:hemerythrin superfamily protein